MNSRGLVIVAVVAIAILLVGSTAFSHSAEAKKRKPSEIKVYVKNVGQIKHKLLLRVCMADDDDCFGKIKTTDLKKHSGDKMATVATYNLIFSGDPRDEFGPKDVLACGTLKGQPHNGGSGSVCVGIEKVKSKHWKAELSYKNLVSIGLGSDTEIID